MKVSKTLSSAVAALAVVGSVGLAFAQDGAQTNNTPLAAGGQMTTPSGAVRGTTNTTNESGTMNMGGAPRAATVDSTQAQPSTTTTMSGSPVERPAQADRN